MSSDDDDEDYNELMDYLERQHAFQTHLLQQSGAGGLDTSIGTFDFELQPFVDRKSSRMGVRERHFNTRLRQRGNLIADQNITEALQDGLRRAVNQVLTTTPDLHDQDRLYFTIGSDRLHTISRAGDYGRVNGVKAGTVWQPSSIDWPKPSTATNNLKWTIRFNCPLRKFIMRLKEPGNPAVANPAIQPWPC